MAFCDFVVRYDAEEDSPRDLLKKILYSIWLKRLKENKPVTIGLFGESGNGKSWSGVELLDLLCELENIDAYNYFEVMNIYTPLQYPEKIDKLIFSKEYKKIRWLVMHEAREVVKAVDWQKFLPQAVSDISAMARSLKRLGTIIISQGVGDITRNMRKMLNFYCKVTRPRGKRTRLQIYVMWQDDRDIEKPKLRKRRLSGYLVDKNGRYRHFIPQYFEMESPRKELAELFEKQDFSAKSLIIKGKIDELIKSMRSELAVHSDKIQIMIDWYVKDMDTLSSVGKMYRGRWKIKSEVAKMHELTPNEVERFETGLNARMNEMGMMGESDE